MISMTTYKSVGHPEVVAAWKSMNGGILRHQIPALNWHVYAAWEKYAVPVMSKDSYHVLVFREESLPVAILPIGDGQDGQYSLLSERFCMSYSPMVVPAYWRYIMPFLPTPFGLYEHEPVPSVDALQFGWSSTPTNIIENPSDWETYWNALPSKTRKNARHLDKLSVAVNYDTRFRDEDAYVIEATLDDWQQRLMVGKLSEGEFSGILEQYVGYDEVFENAGAHGNLRITRVMSIDNPNAKAFVVFLYFETKAVFWFVGKTPAARSYELGNIALYHAIRECFGHSFEYIDLSQGEFQYKSRWCNSTRVVPNFVVYKNEAEFLADKLTYGVYAPYFNQEKNEWAF